MVDGNISDTSGVVVQRKTKVGRKWCYSTDNGLVSWRWKLCFRFWWPPYCFYLVLFPVSTCTAQMIDEFWKNRRSSASDVVPIEWCYIAATANVIGVAWHSTLISEVGNIRRFRP
jgi:hypothetical protein